MSHIIQPPNSNSDSSLLKNLLEMIDEKVFTNDLDYENKNRHDNLKKKLEGLLAQPKKNQMSQYKKYPRILTMAENKEDHSKFIISPNETIKLKLHKKGKKLGNELIREVIINSRSLDYIQKTNNKAYNLPADFLIEMRDPSNNNTISATKLGWNNKLFPNAKYRIVFKSEKSLNYDRAFYFDNEDQFIKVRNYLKYASWKQDAINKFSFQKKTDAISILRIAFYDTIISLIRFHTAKLAIKSHILSTNKKSLVLRRSQKLKEYDKIQLRNISNIWKNRAWDLQKIFRIQYSKEERLKRLLEYSDSLKNYNKSQLKQLTEPWKNEAYKRAEPAKEDLTIIFSELELSKNITDPTIKLEINILPSYHDYPITICGISLYDSKHIILLSTYPKSKQGNKKIKWKMVKAFTNTNHTISNPNNNLFIPMTDAKNFQLTFSSFNINSLGSVEIKISLYNSKNELLAYSYTNLQELYQDSDKSDHIWIALGVKAEQNLDFPLLHLKTKTSNQLKMNYYKQNNLYERASLGSPKSIKDKYYLHSFEFPFKSHRDLKLIAKMNLGEQSNKKNLIDEQIKIAMQQSDWSIAFQIATSKLNSFYHNKMIRHHAKLIRSNYLWASLQDEITSFDPARKSYNPHSNNVSQMWADDEFVSNAAGVNNKLNMQMFDKSVDKTNISFIDYTQIQTKPKLKSFLFKRDRWETTEEWKKYYIKLKDICRKGINPPHRIKIWSELSRVVYFIRITERLYRKLKGVQHFEEKNILSYVLDKKHEEDDSFDEDKELENGKKVYEWLRKSAYEKNFITYQALEEDIIYLKNKRNREKLIHETMMRNICRCLIFWIYLFLNYSSEDELSYHLNYNRNMLILCESLIISQNCSYFDKTSLIEESSSFWILLALVAYILPSYYESSPIPSSIKNIDNKDSKLSRNYQQLIRKSHKFEEPALIAAKVRGIKSDLLLLRLLLKEFEPAIYNKFEDSKMLIEHYFSDHMLTLYCNLFPPGIAYRFMDLIFFEGSGLNQIKCQRIIVCIAFILVRNCKDMILTSKNVTQIWFVVEFYSKFLVKPSTFIKEVYSFVENTFEQKPNKTEKLMDKLTLIKASLFSNPSNNNFDTKIIAYEKMIEDKYEPILNRNKTIIDLVETKFPYNQKDSKILTSLNPLNLQEIANKFMNIYLDKNSNTHINNLDENDMMLKGSSGKKFAYNNNILNEEYNQSRLFRPLKLKRIHIMIHKITLYGYKTLTTKLKIKYNDEEYLINLIDYDLNHLHRYIVFENINNANNNNQKQDHQKNEINIDVVDESYVNIVKIRMQQQLENEPEKSDKEINIEDKDKLCIKSVNIDVSSCEMKKMHNLLLKFENHTLCYIEEGELPSTIYLSLILDCEDLVLPKQIDISRYINIMTDMNLYSKKQASSISIYDIFKNDDEDQNLEKLLRKSDNTILGTISTNLQEFIKIIKKICPIWNDTQLLNKIHEKFCLSTTNTKFYFLEFFTLLIMASQTTFEHKLKIIYEMFSRVTSAKYLISGKLTLQTLNEIVQFLYHSYMIYLPKNLIKNMIDKIYYGYASHIKKIELNNDTKISKKIFNIKILNDISELLYNNIYNKDIPVLQQEILTFLKKKYIEYIDLNHQSPEDACKLKEKNILDIYFHVNGLYHKHTFVIDNQFNPHFDYQFLPNSSNIIAGILESSYNVIPLNNVNKLINKEEFVKIIHNLPLLEYLSSISLIKTQFELRFDRLKFKINLEDEHILTMNTVTNYQKEQKVGSSFSPTKKFGKRLRDWENVSKTAQNLLRLISNEQESYKEKKIRRAQNMEIEQNKLSIFYSFKHLALVIKKKIIKAISEYICDNSSSCFILENLNPKIFRDNLWILNYNFSIRINDVHIINTEDKNQSIFYALLDINPGIFIENNALNIESFLNLFGTSTQEKFDFGFEHTAKYRYPDNSCEWLPCTLKLRYERENDPLDEELKSLKSQNKHNLFGVSFERFPNEIYLVKSSNCILNRPLDISALEKRYLDDNTSLMDSQEKNKFTKVLENTLNRRQSLDNSDKSEILFDLQNSTAKKSRNDNIIDDISSSTKKRIFNEFEQFINDEYYLRDTVKSTKNNQRFIE